MTKTYDNVSDYLKMTRYTYDDLARYLNAVSRFQVMIIRAASDSEFSMLRERINFGEWHSPYEPVIENETNNI